jgi:effector-binding domain-containing protein
MFVGVELLPNSTAPDGLGELTFELPRYLKHLHVGPYQELPAKWGSLKELLAARGETMTLPSLEVYGHHCGDAAKLETTILIGLRPKSD